MSTKAGLLVYLSVYVLVMGAFAMLGSFAWRNRNWGMMTATGVAEIYLLVRVIYLARKIGNLPPPPAPRDHF